MTFKLYSDVRETSATGGTGDQVLTGSAFDASYFRFADRYIDGDTFFYCMKQGTAREVGKGTRVASGDKIARTQVYKSTNSNNLVNFAGGQTIDIFVTEVAPDDLDDAGRALISSAEKNVSAAAGQSFSSSGQAIALKNAGASKTNFNLINGKFVVSAAGGALTVAVKTLAGTDPSATDPVMVPFQDVDGAYSEIAIVAATSLVVPSGAGMAVTSSTAFRLWLTGHNDAGTFRLGAVNCSPSAIEIFPLEAYGLATTTAISSGSNTGGVFYTGTAIASGAPYTALGYVEWGTTGITAGTWTTTNRTRIHLQALGDRLPGDTVRSVYLVTNTGNNTTSGAYQNTSLTKNFTQLSPANINRISYQATCEQSTANKSIVVAFHRDSTAVGPVNVITSSGTVIDGLVGGTLYDRPNISSAVTYGPRFLSLDGATRVDFNNAAASPRATMVIEELMG